jgi:hypothetical protein
LNRSNKIVVAFGIILIVCILLSLGWGNYNFSKKNISGEGFFVQWIGLRALVTRGLSPYDDTISKQIQESVRFQNSFSQSISPRYTSPLYSGIIFFPFALLENNALAHALWLSGQLIAIFFILIVGLRITDWKPSWYIFLLFSALTIFSYHVFLPWLDGGLSIWAAFFLVGAFLAIRNHWNEAGGILLALAAIQPPMTILVILFTLIWGLSKRNKMLIIWFVMTILALSVIVFFLVPGWIVQYLKILYNFSDNFPAGNPGMLFKELWPGLGTQFGWMITAILVIILLIEWYFAMKKDFRWFLWTACLTMVISQWIGIPTIPGNFVGLILPLVLISAMLTEHWPKGGQWISVLLTFIIFVWEWALFTANLNSAHPKMQLNLLIPLPLILFIGLYWVRWWALKPKRLLIEEFRLGETY